ncbi:MAG: hypothetical protein B7Z73_05085 [Planctomycetia bacterium 21-64-5]|nr:MAG: hypothetical protein B7Z73_05085 [Planctomycetia bacterium 21-64-5]HQU43139.1 hypothetical protein [Pirellulales bacterium]
MLYKFQQLGQADQAKILKLIGGSDDLADASKVFAGLTETDSFLAKIAHQGDVALDAGANAVRAYRAGPNFNYEKAKNFVMETMKEYLDPFLGNGVMPNFAADNYISTKGLKPGYRRLGQTIHEKRELHLFEGANLATWMEELGHYRKA